MKTITLILSLKGREETKNRNLPEADAAGIDVDEVALWVVADAAGLLRQCGAAELREGAARDADVDRLAFEMQAVDGDAFAVRMSIALVTGERYPEITWNGSLVPSR